MNLKLLIKDKLYWHYFKSKAKHYPAKFKKAPLYFAGNKVHMDLVSTDLISQQIGFTGMYEYQLSKKITQVAKLGNKSLVDVGANMGYFSILFASAMLSNRVFAFKASPRNHDLLNHNVKLNNLDARISVIPHAAGSQPGTMSFYLGDDNQTGWGGLSNEESVDTITVEVVTLDSYFEDDDLIIDVLKIDVEGADTWVLEGAINLLRAKRIKEIYYEEHVGRMQYLDIKPGTAKALLEQNGYRVRPFGEGEYHAVIA